MKIRRRIEEKPAGLSGLEAESLKHKPIKLCRRLMTLCLISYWSSTDMILLSHANCLLEVNSVSHATLEGLKLASLKLNKY